MIKLIKSLWPFLKPRMGKIVFGTFLAIPLALIKTGQAYLVKPIFDKGLSPSSTYEEVLYLSGLLLGISLLQVPVRFFHFYFVRFALDGAVCDIREKVYDHLQKLPVKYFQNSKLGETLSRVVTDVQLLGIGFQGLIDLIRDPLVAICMLGLALYRDWQLTLVFVSVAPLFAIILSQTGKKIRHYQRGVQENIGMMTQNISEGIQGQKIIKAFGLGDYVVARFRKVQALFFRFQMRSTAVEELASPLVEFVGAVAFSGIIVFAHKRITAGAMSAGDFVSFVTALALLMDPIRKLSRSNIKVNQAIAADERIQKLWETPRELPNTNEECPAFASEIEFRNVSFAYEEKKILKNFNLKIKKGERIAFVGASGGGKTTFMNLLLRFYEPSSGEILIDGKNIKYYSLTSYRQQFALVSQDIFLFNDSIIENLSLGHNYQDNDIENGLVQAQAEEFVSQMSSGVETVIGDRGTKLSGGQAQRLTLARAILRKPEVFLFDEATSALDNESEKKLQSAMEKASTGKTVLSIAHRLSSIKDFDQIVVLRDGEILETGTHDQLLSKAGDYKKLYELSLN